MTALHDVFLLLGSNLENPKKQLKNAASLIERYIGTIVKKSSIYRTAAWGNQEQPDFLNRILKVATALDAEDCLHELLEIENKMGRTRTIRNAPRTIDIDIIFFDSLILDKPQLTLPHPFIAERRFVLVPMNEIAPDFIHPLLLKSIAELLQICTDKLDVSKM